MLTWHDEGYPPRLKEIYDKPPVLYVRGKIMPEDEKIRRCGWQPAGPTVYGREDGEAVDD